MPKGPEVKKPPRYFRVALLLVVGVLLVAAISAVALFANIQRTGCASMGQLLGPASSSGLGIADASQPGACFVSFVALRNRYAEVPRVVCQADITFAACIDYQERMSTGWANFLGTKCTSVAFFGGSDCTCTSTGIGCQAGQWPIEIQR